MEIVCESCGEANPAGTEFCLFCGTYLSWEGSAKPAAPDPRPWPPDHPAAPTQPLPRVAEATVRPAAAPDPVPVPAPAPAAAAVAAAAVPTAAPPGPSFAPSAGPTCPACHRPNEVGRRFCAKCGQVLDPGARPAPANRAATTWQRVSASRDRAARRAYRRSLPPFYRWRRVLGSVLVAALLVGGLTVAGRHPGRWLQQRWYDLRDTTVAVPDLTATTDPPGASAPRSDPAALVDGSEQAWTTPWTPSAEGGSCGGAPGTAVVVLTFPATRVRAIDLDVGLVARSAERPLQFRPKAVGIRFDDGECRRFTLADSGDRQQLVVDSGVAVTSLRLGVDTTFAAGEDGEPVLSITEIALRARPA